eukprot:419046_1
MAPCLSINVLNLKLLLSRTTHTDTLLKRDKKEDYIQGHDEELEICKLKFRTWLADTVGLKQYLSNFEQSECNDIRMIEFLDENTIKNDIGITNNVHVKLMMKKINEMKQLQLEFSHMVNHNKALKPYKQILE